MIDEGVKNKLDELPVDLKRMVLDYMDFLSQKYSGEVKKEKFKFDWEGGLSDLKEKYTAVDLQHKAREWR